MGMYACPCALRSGEDTGMCTCPCHPGLSTSQPGMQQTLSYAPATARPRGILAWFAPDPPIPIRIADPQGIQRGFFRGRVSVMVWATLGYALFYFVRKNLSVAMPVMGEELGIEKDDLGLFLTLHGVLYGVSK